MSWYKEDKAAWKEIIETVAAEERRTTQMVEKDTIQSMFIWGLSKSELPFVFKGGTSLSKVYGLIDRFSEDIDLSMSGKPSESEKKKAKSVVIDVAKDVGLTLVNPDDIQSRNNPSAQPEHDIPQMLREIISSHFYESDYNDITKKLLYEDFPYEEAIAGGIAKVAEMNLFAYEKK